MALRSAMLVAGSLLLATGGAVHAEEPPAEDTPGTASPELRLGVQGIGAEPFPSLGLYVPISLSSRFSVGLGYELLRTFDGYLATSSDTFASPIGVGAVRAGVWWVKGSGRGGFGRVGLLAGVATPWLAIAPMPAEDETGLVLEGGVDASLGYSWSFARIAVNLTPIVAIGAIENRVSGGLAPGGVRTDHQDIRTFGVDATLSFSLRL